MEVLDATEVSESHHLEGTSHILCFRSQSLFTSLFIAVLKWLAFFSFTHS
jgi:hypothetical protein